MTDCDEMLRVLALEGVEHIETLLEALGPKVQVAEGSALNSMPEWG